MGFSIRPYQPSDKPAIEEMFRAQGFDYGLPDPDGPLFIVRMVLEENGKPVQALLGRLTSEAYLLFDPNAASPVTHMRRFLGLHQKACEAAQKAGIDSVNVWLPPKVSKLFGGQLERLGWKNYIWPSYMRKI
jgi:hypothetical protein